MVRYCAVHGCFQSNRRKERRFFSFPSEEQRCQQWIKVIGRKDLANKDIKILSKSYFVCNLHFSDSDLVVKQLQKYAVPTLLLPQLESAGNSKLTQTEGTTSCGCTSHSNGLQIQCSQSVQTDAKLMEDSPRVRKLSVELKSEQKKRRLLETQIQRTKAAAHRETTDVSSPLLKKIIDMQKKVKPHSRGNRYDRECITFALNAYFSGPAAYRLLSETLCLPSVRTLQKRAVFEISTKMDDIVIKSLEFKIRKMTESEKCCIICANEMSLKRHLHYQINKDKIVGFHEMNGCHTKEIATRAFVVMARGLYSNWKQPLAFCFLSQNKNYADLNIWLERIISKMIEIGFNVVAFTSDQSQNFIDMANDKSVSTEQPFFHMNDKKIYHIFDIPYLTKSIRNNLLKYDFIYRDVDGSEQIASWDDIESVFVTEKAKRFKIASKLTQSHIRPSKAEKKRVKYATQVLSRTVAVAICSSVETAKLPEKSLGTAKFVELINDTFDILNSSTVENDYKYKKAFYGAEYQTTILIRAQRILSELRVINPQDGTDVTNNIKCFKSLLISIKAISNLASDLHKAGHKYLFTRRLNHDALELFFQRIRLSGNCREPSSIQFYKAFKKLFMVNIIKQSDHATSSDDLDQLLMSVEESQNSFRSEQLALEPSRSTERALQVGTCDYRLDLPEENAFTYVAGYLLKKCLDYHSSCEILRKYVENNDQVNDNTVFPNFNVYQANPSADFVNPPEDFEAYIRVMNSICEEHFLNDDLCHLGNAVVRKFYEIVFTPPCPCFPLEYLKKLFVRFRIFHLIQQNNKNFKGKSCKGKCFSVSNL